MMASVNNLSTGSIIISVLLVLLLSTSSSSSSSPLKLNPSNGKWKLLKKSIGISAMHIALLPNDRIITFDRTNMGHSNITFPAGKCPPISDCSAHSVEFTPCNRTVRPLTILTDTWCSSGALLPDGVLIQSGGWHAGGRVVRTLRPCADCDWLETPNGLLSPRWYASNQVLPNGKIIVVGGRHQFNYEFIPKTSVSDPQNEQYYFQFLKETRHTIKSPNNLYPFTHLNTDGNLFIFANDRAVLLDYMNNKVVRSYPVLPGGVSRNYPSTGSSVLLPLQISGISPPLAEVFICGGSVRDAYDKTKAGVFVDATETCGRLRIDVANAQWEMSRMPLKRVMGDMLLLPTGDVLMINGAARGSAGWHAATDPVLNPVLYRPDTKTFDTMVPTKIPRMYHSSAHLLSDGRVLVSGSNPYPRYNFTSPFPTDLSAEAFYPPYLCCKRRRPKITRIKPGVNLVYRQSIEVIFWWKAMTGDNPKFKCNRVDVTMVAPSFTTHSFSMNQRVLVLEVVDVRRIGSQHYKVVSLGPATLAVAPPGYYQLFVVYDGVPSKAHWVRIGN